MFKKKGLKSDDLHKPIDDSTVDNSSLDIGDSSVKATKLSFKQTLLKFLLISDMNKKLIKPVRLAKTEMIKNFHDGGCDVEDVNKLFWIYFHENKDIFVPKHLASHLSTYKVFLDDADDDCDLTFPEYFFVLKYIRNNVLPLNTLINSFMHVAHEYARNNSPKDDSEIIYTEYDREDGDVTYNGFVKEKFEELMNAGHESVVYDKDWFEQQKAVLPTTWKGGNYGSLLVFAVLGMHYFNKGQAVYDTFTQEELQETLTLSFPKNNSKYVSLTLEDFLRIIERLEFKKHVFTY